MRISFNLKYRTRFGETLKLNTTGPGAASHAMATPDGETWTCALQWQDKAQGHIDYYYSVEKGGREARREWESVPHHLELVGTRSAGYTVYDRWIDLPDDAPYYSSAFTECINRRAFTPSDSNGCAKLLRIKVRATLLPPATRLAIIGSAPYLGQWKTPCHAAMAEHTANEWVVSLDATKLASARIEFKFVAVGNDGNIVEMWEEGQNRTIDVPPMQAGDVVVWELEQARFSVSPWRGAGVVVPVFSLRSRDSFGVGDFADLLKMVRWAASVGLHALQVLPINDTTASHTWTDSYPYCSISVYALHPQYAALGLLPPLADADRRDHYERLRSKLNALPEVDYEQANAAKADYLRELYAQTWRGVCRRTDFKQFFADNKDWLVPYAAFCTCRDAYGTPDFTRWPGHRTLTDNDMADLANPKTKACKEASYWYFVQYILDSQMRAVHEEARRLGVILKGDIPIGVARHGVETWTQPQYFNMDGQAGAPPDAFSKNGQNWGFPTYNWEAILADGCSWWTKRLKKMEAYFDAYRIDHILGFFRIWEIPAHSVHGLLGQFVPALGMTMSEIGAYGLEADRKTLTEPYITDGVLERLFGERAGEVKAAYLEPRGSAYAMRPEYDTQRKVEAAFAGKEGKDDAKLRDGLYRLISNVLFVADRTDPNRLHPRIAAQTDLAYPALSDRNKTAFNRLYDDYYYRRHNQFWYNEAMRKLPRLSAATRMLICAEDLGMVPDCVPWAMEKLRILSLEIQSMPKQQGLRFGRLAQNPYLSVCTITTHDMPTLRQWWDEDAKRTQAYFETALHHKEGAPHPLPAWLATDIVERHLMCPSMLCLISLQDWLATSESLRRPDAGAERINVPANPRNYWRYRMHLDIEDLAGATDFCRSIKEMVAGCGRG